MVNASSNSRLCASSLCIVLCIVPLHHIVHRPSASYCASSLCIVLCIVPLHHIVHRPSASFASTPNNPMLFQVMSEYCRKPSLEQSVPSNRDYGTGTVCPIIVTVVHAVYSLIVTYRLWYRHSVPSNSDYGTGTAFPIIVTRVLAVYPLIVTYQLW